MIGKRRDPLLRFYDGLLDGSTAMSPALESNAGDRYHFVYAARRLVDMLHPRLGLQRVVMEGVAPEDAQGDDEATYLGVDLTEYYGGTTTETASSLCIAQVNTARHTPQRPGRSPG